MAVEPALFLSDLLKRMNFEPDDRQVLQTHADWGLKIAPEMADCFYTYLGNDAEMNRILHATDARIHNLKITFIAWFHEMFTGIDNWGNQYADRRWQIGLTHVRIGIGPQHVVPAMATVVQAMGRKLKEEEKSEVLQNAVSKICMVDLTFIEQAYVEVSSAAVLRETGWSEKLFRRLIVTGTKAQPTIE